MTAQHIVVSLHVLFAVFVIGPLVFATSATPRAIRTGGAPMLRFLTQTTRVYSVVSLVVLALGLGAVQKKYDFHYSQVWIWLSIVLYVVALGLLTGLVVPAQRRAARLLEEAKDATGQIAAISAGAGLAGTAFGVIVFLMIFKPGR